MQRSCRPTCTGDDRLIVLLGGGREILSLADNLSFLLIANDPQ